MNNLVVGIVTFPTNSVILVYSFIKIGIMKNTYLILLILSSFSNLFSQGESSSITFYFEFGKDILTPKSQEELENFIVKTKDKKYNISIFTQCDTTGSVEYNKALSDMRLSKMKTYFKGDNFTIEKAESRGELSEEKASETKKEFQRKAEVSYVIDQARIEEISSEIVETGKADKFAAVLNTADKSKIAPIVLDIQFVGGTAIFLSSAYPEIESLYSFMDKNKTVKAFIRGHVCCSSNMQVSDDRARVVYEYLVKNGIDPKRLTFKGFDNTMPVVFPEVTAEDQQRNRRVDVLFNFE